MRGEGLPDRAAPALGEAPARPRAARSPAESLTAMTSPTRGGAAEIAAMAAVSQNWFDGRPIGEAGDRPIAA